MECLGGQKGRDMNTGRQEDRTADQFNVYVRPCVMYVAGIMFVVEQCPRSCVSVAGFK